jgi:hypothetical protein
VFFPILIGQDLQDLLFFIFLDCSFEVVLSRYRDMEWLVHLVIRLAQSVTSDCLISPGKTNRFWDRDLCVLARHTVAVNLFLIPNHYPRVLSGSIQWMLDMWIFGWCSFSSKINFVCKWFVCNFNNKFVYSHRCFIQESALLDLWKALLVLWSYLW